MKKTFLFVTLIIILVCMVCIAKCFYKNDIPPVVKTYSDYNNYHEKAIKYCKSNKLDTSFYFLIDLSVHSGIKRFYLCDFSKQKITEKYMVSHGCGSFFWSWDLSKTNPNISNEKDSHSSSTGKYIVGKRGKSQWGIKINYLLHGMDSSNSNALKRNIVLHSWNAISEEETFPDGTPEGWGCPAVSNSSLKRISVIIDSSKKPVLLWVIK
jgi:hypothetical protein